MRSTLFAIGSVKGETEGFLGVLTWDVVDQLDMDLAGQQGPFGRRSSTLSPEHEDYLRVQLAHR